MLLMDAVLLVANLMYFRTYYTAIPLSSYALSGNLADFTGSVYGNSFRWYDAFFPLTLACTFTRHCAAGRCVERTSYRCYAVLSGIAIVLFAATTLLRRFQRGL